MTWTVMIKIMDYCEAWLDVVINFSCHNKSHQAPPADVV